MTCKDCIHFDVCGVCQKAFLSLDKIESECIAFKDKSRTFELPCKVGDTVFEIEYDSFDVCTECDYISIGFGDYFCTKNYCEYPDPISKPKPEKLCPKHSLIICEQKDVDLVYIARNLDNFGKTVFLNREEAEKKLEELQ